jgi:hypothetical protein
MMKRILLLVTAALVMAATLLVMAMPAFAYHAPRHVGLAAYHDKKEGTEICLSPAGGSLPGVSDCTQAAVKGGVPSTPPS